MSPTVAAGAHADTKLPSEVRKADLALTRTYFVYWANTAQSRREVAAAAEVAGRLADSTIAALESRERADADPLATRVQLEGARQVAGLQLTALLAAGLSARVGFALGEPDFSVATLLLQLGANLEGTDYRVCPDCATVFNPARRRGPQRFRCRRCGKTPRPELSDPRVRAVLPTFAYGSGSIRRQGWAAAPREHHCHTCGAAFLAERRDRIECDDCHDARRRLKGARPTGEPAEPKHVLAPHFADGTPLEVIEEYDSAVSEAIRAHLAEKLGVYWTARRAGVIPAPPLDRDA